VEGVTHYNETFACDCNLCWCEEGTVYGTQIGCNDLGDGGGFGDVELGAGGAVGAVGTSGAPSP
jgi:hypothetical protein